MRGKRGCLAFPRSKPTWFVVEVEHPMITLTLNEAAGFLKIPQLSPMDVSPLRGAGLLRCASSRCQRPSVSPLRAAIPRAGSPAPSALAGAQGVAGLRR